MYVKGAIVETDSDTRVDFSRQQLDLELVRAVTAVLVLSRDFFPTRSENELWILEGLIESNIKALWCLG